MKITRIGTPCRGGDRAVARRSLREAGQLYPHSRKAAARRPRRPASWRGWWVAHRESTPARMAKVWLLEADRVRLAHLAFWTQVARCVRYR